MSGGSTVADLSKADQDLYLHAYDIFEKYHRGEFDLSPKASTMNFTNTRTWREEGWMGRMKDKKEVSNISLADIFTHAITGWEVNKGSWYDWKLAAEKLVEAEGFVRNHDCKVPGRSFQKLLNEKEGQAKKLAEENEGLKLKLEQIERHLKDCRETNLVYEKQIRDNQELKDDQRKEDMLRSLLQGKGTEAPTESSTSRKDEEVRKD